MNKKIWIIGINACWIILGYLVFITSLQDTIIARGPMARNLQYLFPQGWAFFTKSPKEILIDVYEIKDRKLQPVDMMNVSAANLFGFSRMARMKGYELSLVVSPVPAARWKKNTAPNLLSHLNDTTMSVTNKYKFKYFDSGTYLFKQRLPVPWAWSGENQDEYTPYKTLKIKIN
jgi:antimicrobial peptide system SdpA family protein